MDIIQKVKDLNLKPDQYVVVGSGILAVLGIRTSDDIDIVVDLKTYTKYKQLGWEEKIWPKGNPTIEKDIYELGTDWGDDTNIFTLNELLKDKVVIEGVNFVTLEQLRAWKVVKNREKDLADIALIDTYLQEHSTD